MAICSSASNRIVVVVVTMSSNMNLCQVLLQPLGETMKAVKWELKQGGTKGLALTLGV